MKNPEVSIILPCRNEEKTIGKCIEEIKKVIQKNKLSAEIIVSDSSIDKSPTIAKKHKVILIKHDKEGYGNAYLEAFKIARGKYIFMADSDCTYEFSEIPAFIAQLKSGNDLVIGNRFKGNIEKGAMPWSHKYIGTPVLSALQRLFFRSSIRDINSGIRAIKSSALNKLNLQATGMEFASEMIVKSLRNNLKIKELPVNYKKRIGQSKLRSFSDGWKHLRFMLLYSPLYLFLLPGAILFLIGIIMLAWFHIGNPIILGKQMYFHPMFFFAICTIIGYQTIIFAAFAKIYSVTHLNEKDELFEKLFRYITIERAGIFGLLLGLIGIIIYLNILIGWINSGFGSLNEIKNSITALTLTVLGVQTIFSAFMLSILGIKEK